MVGITVATEASTSVTAKPMNATPPLVLVCEDDDIIAAALRRMLEHAGFVVLGPAATNTEALALVASLRPDAALLDGQLADGTSDAIAKELRRLGVPFVVSSAADPADLPNSLQGSTFVAKPASFSEIRDAIKEIT